MQVQTMPWEHASPVTPDDANDLANFGMAVVIGGAGTLKVTTIKGDVVALNSLPAGTILPLHVKRIWSTGTSATNINILY